MRFHKLAGIVLVVAGGLLLLRGSFTSRREVLDVGGVTLTVVERHPVEPWVAVIALVVGFALLVADSRRRL